MDRSRCSPGPPCSTRRRTASAPNAANTPPMYSPRSPPIAIGGPAGSPRKPGEPAQACKVNSLAARSAYGPVQPKSEIVTTTDLGRVGQQLPRIDAQRGAARRAGGDDDHVGGGQFRAPSLGIGREGHASFAGVEVAVKRGRPVSGHRRTGSGVPPQPIPLWWFDFPHLRPGVDQQLAAVAASYPVADLHDT